MMIFQEGTYIKKIENSIYEYRILKVMKKTLSIELRTFDQNGDSDGDFWFSYRWPKERIDLSDYNFKPN